MTHWKPDPISPGWEYRDIGTSAREWRPILSSLEAMQLRAAMWNDTGVRPPLCHREALEN